MTSLVTTTCILVRSRRRRVVATDTDELRHAARSRPALLSMGDECNPLQRETQTVGRIRARSSAGSLWRCLYMGLRRCCAARKFRPGTRQLPHLWLMQGLFEPLLRSLRKAWARSAYSTLPIEPHSHSPPCSPPGARSATLARPRRNGHVHNYSSDDTPLCNEISCSIVDDTDATAKGWRSRRVDRPAGNQPAS